MKDHDLVLSLPDNIERLTHSRMSECDDRPVQVEPSPVNRMVTASAAVQTDLSQVVHSSCRFFCHSPEPQSFTTLVSSPRPKCLGHRCSEHKVGSHCLYLPAHGSPSQGDPKSQAIQLPDHRNSPRLAKDALVLDVVQLSTEIPLQLPVSRTLLKQSHNYVFHSNPQHLNFHACCLGVDSSKNKASLWKWQRELLPLRDRQEGLSTIQSGPYLKMVQRRFGGFLHSLCTCTKILTGALRPLMVIGWPLLTIWAQRGSISLKVETLTGYSPVFTGFVPKDPGIF